MLSFGIAMWVVGLVALAWVWRNRRDRMGEIFAAFCRSGRIFVGIVPLALIAAGFLTPLVPRAVVADWLGDSAGFDGLLVAMAAGWCMPLPPPVFFPTVAVLLKAGAGMAQMVTLVVAWNIFALHRTLPIELPLMGRYFVILRLASSALLPLLAGAIAMAIG